MCDSEAECDYESDNDDMTIDDIYNSLLVNNLIDLFNSPEAEFTTDEVINQLDTIHFWNNIYMHLSLLYKCKYISRQKGGYWVYCEVGRQIYQIIDAEPCTFDDLCELFNADRMKMKRILFGLQKLRMICYCDGKWHSL